MQRLPVGVRSHILLTVIAVVVVGFGSIYLVVTPLIEATIRDEHRERMRWLAEVIARDLATEATDVPTLDTALQRWSRTLPGVCLAVTDAQGQLHGEGRQALRRCVDDGPLDRFLASPDRPRWSTEAPGDRLLLSVPADLGRVEYGPGQGGRLVYAGTILGMTQRLDAIRTLLLLSMGLAVGLVTLIGYGALTQLIIRPLSRIGRAIDRVHAGDLNAHAELTGGQELRRLGDAFNRLARKLGDDEARIGRQISELKLMNEELERARDHLVRSEKLASVGTLAAGVAHEIGNPISIVLGYLEVLRRPDVTPEERASYLEQAAEATQRVDRIIRDLLDFARPSADEPERCEVRAAVEQTVQLLQPQRRLKHLTIEVDMPDEPVYAGIGEHRLQQVLVNLLLNAADATAEAGEGAVHIGVSREDADRVRVVVADDGPGIPRRDRRHIFDPFYTTKEPGSGTGLGLSICYNIVVACGGDIRVDSAVGEGAVFTLDLPGPRA